MRARQRINALRVQIAVIVAGILGALTGSILVSLVALAVLLTAGVAFGEIRR